MGSLHSLFLAFWEREELADAEMTTTSRARRNLCFVLLEEIHREMAERYGVAYIYFIEKFCKLSFREYNVVYGAKFGRAECKYLDLLYFGNRRRNAIVISYRRAV